MAAPTTREAEDRHSPKGPGRHHTDRPARRSARRAPAVALVVLVALIGVSCAPPSPPAGGGGVEIELGPLTVPLPPIEVRAPATNIPFGICSIAYRPPGVNINGATLTIPRIRIDPDEPVVTVPNVSVRIPDLRVPLSTVTLRCGLLALPVQVDLIVPSTVKVRAATLDLDVRTVTLTNPSLTLDGAGLGIPGLGDLVIPLPPIVDVPLPTTAIAF
ncbi:MAG: hypothetical protein R2716_12185 [Microthrixaceae bacterium]